MPKHYNNVGSADRQRKKARPIMRNARYQYAVPHGPGLNPRVVDKKAMGAARNKLDAHK